MKNKLENNDLGGGDSGKNAFLSSMSHEVRTPLNAILGMTGVGINAHTIEEKDYALRKIGDAATHLLDIISNVLDMAMIADNKFELTPCRFAFRDMVEKVVSQMRYLAGDKYQTIRLSIDNAIPGYVIGDDVRISRLISNIVSNAVKFTPMYGKIYVEINLLRDCGERLELRIIVSDNGIGMSEEQQHRFFSAFRHRHSALNHDFGGVGFGLLISKHIVELMDGDIWVESLPGKGTTVSFTIMLGKSPEDDATSDEPEPPGNDDDDGLLITDEFKGRRMLIVEDVEINREILIAQLKNSGLKIDYAEDGQMAVDMVMFNVEKYDIVFMDLQMPNMGGLEATRLIRKLPERKRGHLPIIAMTANNMSSDLRDCFDAGMDDHLCKPLDIEKVLTVLRKYL